VKAINLSNWVFLIKLLFACFALKIKRVTAVIFWRSAIARDETTAQWRGYRGIFTLCPLFARSAVGSRLNPGFSISTRHPVLSRSPRLLWRIFCSASSRDLYSPWKRVRFLITGWERITALPVASRLSPSRSPGRLWCAKMLLKNNVYS